MRVSLLGVLWLLLLSACGTDRDAPPTEGDPGRPGLMYGTKAGGDLFVGETKVGFVFFSFLAPDEPDRAHVFARPDDRASEGVQHYYLSLVVSGARWSASTYTRVLGGRAEFVLADGTRYAGAATNLELHAEILRTVVIDGAHYPTGRLTLRVPAEVPGAAPLEARLSINNPDASE